MSFFEMQEGLPAEFQLALQGLSQPYLRQELKTDQIASPDGIGDFAVAFSCHVPNTAETASNRGVGRIVFVFDEDQADTWGSNMRIIAYVKSPLESEMEKEEDSANYYWGTLNLALQKHGALSTHEAGTVTKMASTGMGALASDQTKTEIELRASWSPTNYGLDVHFAAWQDLVAAMAGFAIEGESVAKISKAV